MILAQLNVRLIQAQAGVRILRLLDQVVDDASLVITGEQFAVERDQLAEL